VAEDDLPGVIFRFRGAEKSKTFNGTTTIIKVTLDAEVQSEELWAVVREKLTELKIYTVNDFKTELAEVLRVENVAIERKATELEVAYRNLLESNKRLTESHQKLQEEAAQMREAFSVLSSQLFDGELGREEPEG
jgi:hypothetical protein